MFIIGVPIDPREEGAMRRTEEIRISRQASALLKFTQIMAQVAEGHKTPKGALAERLIYRGAIDLAKRQGWDIPEDLKDGFRPERDRKTDQAAGEV